MIVVNHWVRWSTSYTPYGLTYNECKAAIKDDDGAVAGCLFEMNLRAPGQYFDAETGFYYNGQRYYVPLMRRYNRPEPIGQAGSLDLYMYAGGNPVNRIDPTGLVDWEATGRATAGIIGNSLGILAGIAIGSTGPATFGLSTVAGGAIVFKSGYGLSANVQNLVAAIRDEQPVSRGNVFNDVADIAAPGNEQVQGVATAADLGVDLLTLRASAIISTPDLYVKGSKLIEGGSKLGPTFFGNADQLLKVKIGIDLLDTFYQQMPDTANHPLMSLPPIEQNMSVPVVDPIQQFPISTQK